MLLKVKDVSEVQNTIMEHFGGFVVESEEVGLLEAPGRVAAEDIKAVYSVTDFNNPAADG